MKNTIIIGMVLSCLSLLLAPAFSTMAENSKPPVKNSEQRPLPEHRGGKPPPQAIASCVDVSEQSACSFQGPRTLDRGICEFTPDKQYFACNPSRQAKQPQQTISENK